ncbi:MAG: four helix bundle protein [Chitinophagaceae bacterium]|nr:MAG: four helix bundle protein [Chitinophagaceae bacterium]
MAKRSLYQTNNPLLNLTFDFAIAVIAYCKVLRAMREFDMSRQLFKSGTSIHAHVREAQHPASAADFVHKLKGGQKEACETEGWLLMCLHSSGYPDTTNLLNDPDPIQRLLTSSIDTANRNRGSK